MSAKLFILSTKVVILNDQGRCLLIRRSMSSKGSPGKWDLPGGKIDPGEAFETALAREVSEETGLTITIRRVLGATESEAPDKKVVYLVMGATVSPGKVKLSSEHDAHVWASVSEIEKGDLQFGLLEQFRPFVLSYTQAGRD